MTQSMDEPVVPPDEIECLNFTYIDPHLFRPRRGIITRYGHKLLEEGAKFYSRISIQGNDSKEMK